MNFNRFNLSKRQFSKRNFSDVIEVFIPEYYKSQDIENFGKVLDPFEDIINTHIFFANNVGTVLPLSAGTTFSSLNTLSGISPFFFKENEFSQLSPAEFERLILNLDGRSFKNFTTSSTFRSYLETNLIPKITTNSPTLSSIDYLISHLGWFYFLSCSSTQTYQPSASVVNCFVDKLYRGDSLTISDGINALTEFLWYNQDSLSSYIPTAFASGTGEYVSGTQQLEKLKTLNSILYSSELLDKQDAKVRESFEDFISTGDYLETRISNGPFWKLVKAFSFAFADQQNEVNKINVLYDLQDCPDDLLPDLANLIGWPLLGYDPNRWRLQLANAVSIYKSAGTKQSIQTAVNSVFTEGIIDLDGVIYELWESYIPFIIMYALATESVHFKDYTTWTPKKATSLGIQKYDRYNFETNIRLAVDKILLTLVEEFPDHFILANKRFNLNDPNFVFNYRGRDYPIPPFEEIPYYVNCNITKEFLFRVADLLACYGVSTSFALKVKNYIESNTILATDDIREGNGWLFFTSGVETPPNWDDIIGNPNNTKENFLSLWSGKSSHYKMIFSGTDFDFSKSTYEVDSKQVILIASRAGELFSPAHSIQDTKVLLDDSDTLDVSSVQLPLVVFDRREQITSSPSSVTFTNKEISGIDFLNGLDEFSGTRESYSSLTMPMFSRITATSDPRTSLRRRNYHNTLNLGGFYDRTGFNMPITLQMEISGSIDNNAFYVGFIPSSMTFASGASMCDTTTTGIPSVYQKCNWSTSASFYGYDASNTLSVRGNRPIYSNAKFGGSGVDYFVDRGQLDEFIQVIHRVKNDSILKKYEQHVADNLTVYAADMRWKNVSASLANDEINCSGLFLSSIKDYEDFSFGRKVSKLYDLYTSAFNRHPTRYDISLSPGPNIFAHCYGSILENSDFETRGSIAVTYSLYNQSTSAIRLLDRNTAFFSGTPDDLLTYGTVIASASNSLIASSTSFQVTQELVNSSIINGVDIVHTSGAALANMFAVYDFLVADTTAYINNRAFVKLRSINGLPRLRYRIEGSDFSDSYDSLRASNFLNPNDIFEFSIHGLAATNDGKALVNKDIGIWIHTENEGGEAWHYNKDGEWERIANTSLTIPRILGSFTHVRSFKGKDRSRDASGNPIGFQCLAIDPDDPNASLSSLGSYTEDEFQTLTVKFNTKNTTISVPDSYFKNFGQVHRYNQRYVIELFEIPNRQNTENFTLLESVNLVDKTLWDMTRIEVTGTPTGHKKFPLCDIKYVDLTKDELRIIFNYYNQVCGKSSGDGILSRYSFESSGLNMESGGSRLDYRTNPEWHSRTIDSGSEALTEIII